MAASTKTDDAKTVLDTATKAMEEATVKAQEQYFSLLEQGQAAVLESYGTMIDAVGKVELPAIPGLDAMKIPANAFDGYFDFAAKMLDNQREFAAKMLATTAKA